MSFPLGISYPLLSFPRQAGIHGKTAKRLDSRLAREGFVAWINVSSTDLIVQDLQERHGEKR